jgi:hypothetical protein
MRIMMMLGRRGEWKPLEETAEPGREDAAINAAKIPGEDW